MWSLARVRNRVFPHRARQARSRGEKPGFLPSTLDKMALYLYYIYRVYFINWIQSILSILKEVTMMYSLVKGLDKVFGFERAKAHCDIPCGIYDPITAQIAALTVVRMMDLMDGLANTGDKAYANSMSRYVAVKEEHAEKAKHEIRVIWGDFIKPEHTEQYPELNGLVHKIMKLGSQSRQTADRAAGVALVEAVNEFAEIFWKIKGVATKKAKAPYAPALELVYPNL
jgi:nickel superoxide dismutase